MKAYDVVDVLKVRLKSATSMFTDDELEQAVSTASLETGWTLPVTGPFRAFWLQERAYRAAIAMLCIDSAHKFKFKQINLQHRWEHYSKMLEQMDRAFEKARAEHPEEFMDNLTSLTDAEKVSMFGDYIPPTFKYPVG